MYNRYIPQSDGSYRRNRVPEPVVRPGNPGKPQPPQPGPPCTDCPRMQPLPPRQEQAEGFLRRLLPQGLDTEDLLIVVLLLLMSGDCRDDRNLPLLTLALYLFL